MFIVEARTLRSTGDSTNLCFAASDYIHFASTLDRAEHWIQGLNPGYKERYCFVIIEAQMDSDLPFELIGYYDIIGQKTTKQRCIQAMMT
jgi:hypothetical protein